MKIFCTNMVDSVDYKVVKFKIYGFVQDFN